MQFFRRTHPGGAGWTRLAAKVPEVKGDTGYGRLFLDWLLGVVVVYSFLFGLGDLLFGAYLSESLILALGLAAGAVIYYDLSKRGLGGTAPAGSNPSLTPDSPYSGRSRDIAKPRCGVCGSSLDPHSHRAGANTRAITQD